MGLISSLFNPATGSPSTGGLPAVPTIPATQTTPAGIDPTGIDPALVTPGKEDSQLAEFANMWQTPVDADGKPIVHTDPLASPVVNFDLSKLTESSKRLDFVSKLDPELAAKALAGDASALASYVNSAIQTAVMGVTQMTGTMMNQAIDSNNARLNQTLPTQIKRVQLNQMDVDNPIFNDPAVAPLVQALKQTEFNKNPNANPADVQKKIIGYLTGLAKVVSDTAPEKVAASKATAAKEMDWVDWSTKT